VIEERPHEARKRTAECSRHVASKDDYVALEAELPRLFEAQPKLRARADRAQSILSSCKYFLDQLPDGTALDIVEVTPAADLPAVRAQIAKLGEERRSIINAPPSPQEMASEVRAWVVAVGEQGRPSMLLRDNAFAPKWGGSANVDPSDRPRSVFGVLCWAVPDVVVACLQRELERTASALSLLTRAEREQRLQEIEVATLQLRYEEETLIAAAIARGEDVTRDAAAPAEAVLQIRLRARPPSSARVRPDDGPGLPHLSGPCSLALTTSDRPGHA
jgi:hypothetical protein